MSKFSYLKEVVLMKNTKKIIAMTIAFIMTGVMLAGCGNGVDHKDYMKDSDSVTASVDKDVEKDSDKKSETADKADTDKKDEAQSETEKKADSADKADKDSTAETANQSDNSSSADNSSNTGNSGNAGNSNSGSVSKPNTGSGNSNTGNNGNHNGSVNKPSGGNNSNSGNSGNNGNHNGGSNNNGNGNNGGDNNKPAPHEHNFNIWKDEVSHTEMVTEEYTEEVPKYTYVACYVCKKCGAEFSTSTDAGNHCMDVCGSTYKHVSKQVQNGFETVTKTREVPKTVVDDPAHYECSCGARQ